MNGLFHLCDLLIQASKIKRVLPPELNVLATDFLGCGLLDLVVNGAVLRGGGDIVVIVVVVIGVVIVVIIVIVVVVIGVVIDVVVV